MLLIEQIENKIIRDTGREPIIKFEQVTNKSLGLALKIARRINFSDSGEVDFTQNNNETLTQPNYSMTELPAIRPNSQIKDPFLIFSDKEIFDEEITIDFHNAYN
jgi:hypothetical protein